jgi:hypothetical protein
MTKEFTVGSTDPSASTLSVCTYDVRHPDQAARLWAEEWLDTSGDECTVLVTCGEESWRFDVSVTAPEYDVKEAAT